MENPRHMATILFPTDFSPNADHALEYLLPLADKLQAKVVLLHVFSIPTPQTENPIYAWEEQVKLKESLVMAELKTTKEQISHKYPRLEVECVPRFGFTVPAILLTAQEYNADWIIMGTKGASGIKRVLLGSNTAQVISRATCPVLAVPKTEVFHGIKRIIYATNYEHDEILAIYKLSKLADLFNAEIQVVHIFTEKEHMDPERYRKFEEDVRATVQSDAITFKLIPHTDLKAGLEELMTYTRADLLAMSPHKRGFLDRLFHPSQTQSMAYHTHTPLLAVPGV
jgi:nucleotide-binding universal stress UspA family protein